MSSPSKNPERVAIFFSRRFFPPGIELGSPSLWEDSLLSEPPIGVDVKSQRNREEMRKIWAAGLPGSCSEGYMKKGSCIANGSSLGICHEYSAVTVGHAKLHQVSQ